ncbi:hypothetical protein V499_05487 [Pseudogymnoascus sp. VKM F-103]|uniref:Uncharacterized protein n=1 Tax=Pseudogymnoascus verrucosus TaxID=342668 RepID=A0A1B8GT95_9PEZI|nr:uncharacterized protein VE01_02321 [Pseudogymnoascus verrucosus]KFY74491.1 hypothetical protein V499_05487 [Pseudogymnoascus sp. VKM F-103]OBT99062.1 hypothetical protein VE01_02321 [Pseudogymnoascus verrucosus]
MKISAATIVLVIGLAVAAPAAEPVAEPAAVLEARTCPAGPIVESCWNTCKSQGKTGAAYTKCWKCCGATCTTC